ncbi:MAG: MurR/RpiR family transcriptional regulator [Candidatus Fimivivens sp.]|nr:MurR/RpiR family transcriptional regulator [Candidatus Fimivivens sp.]
MENNIFSLIDNNYEFLSKTQRLICDYIKKNYINISYLPITEFAEQVSASVGSIVGLCKTLGYSGYSEFQKDLQNITKQQIFAMTEIKNSISDCGKTQNILYDTIQNNIDNLNYTYNEQLEKSFEHAVNYIVCAKTIYVIGLRSVYAAAYYFHFMLSDFMSNVRLITPGTGDMYDRIMDITPDDTLVCIGFETYTQITCDITRFFRNRKCKIISITDQMSSPLASMSDATLIAQNSSTTFSFVSAMTILNAIIIAVGRKNKNNTINELEKRQRYLQENNVHYH